MLCEHLRDIEKELIFAGYKETFRGKPWTNNCREWVYFEVELDIEKLKERFELSSHVDIHENPDPKSGSERGIVCKLCHDAIMGKISSAKRFPE